MNSLPLIAAAALGLSICTRPTTAQDSQPAPALRAGSPSAERVEFSDVELRRILQLSPLPPLAPDPTNRFADNPDAARLGQVFFFDTGLSANGKIACSTCHDPAKNFTDGKQVGEGIGKGVRHTPTLLNVAYQRWLFWDGRSDSLWSQPLNPLEDPLEMGASRTALVRRIASSPSLRSDYERLFGATTIFDAASRLPANARPVPDEPGGDVNQAWESLSPTERLEINRVAANFGKALAAYERRLVSAPSPFDRFAESLRSNTPVGRDALSPAAQRGLKLFVGAANCRFCHSGPLLSDMEFHTTLIPPLDRGQPRDAARYAGVPAVLADPFNARGPFSDERDGTAARRLEFLANRPDNWGLFRTPTLRNVALTPPYMHEGQFANLREVVEHYSTMKDAISTGHHKRETILNPLNLTERGAADLIAFLESLTSPPVADELRRAPEGP